MRANKILAFLLSFVLLTNLLCIKIEAAEGYDYTDSSALAEELNDIFSGDVDLYINGGMTKEKIVPLNDRINNGTMYYVKSEINDNVLMGWQCYIYANAVYNKLFGEFVGHGNNLSKSEIVISGGKKSVSYDLFANADVKCGAYMRTTINSNGSYNGNVGHSIILLSYDETNISYLEGNGDGNGLVRICTSTWSKFNHKFFSSKSRRLCHIVQPTQEHYESLYNSYADTVIPVSDKSISLGTVSGTSKNITISCMYENGILKCKENSSIYKIELVSQADNTYTYKISSKAKGNDVVEFYLYDEANELLATQKVSVNVVAPYLEATESNVSLVMGKESVKEVILSVKGNIPEKYHFDIDFSEDFAKVYYENTSNNKLNINIEAQKAGNGTITCKLINEENNISVASYNIKINVSLEEYTINYDMNGIENIDKPGKQEKLYAESIKLSSFTPQNIEYTVKIDKNTASDEVVSEKHKCIFAGWNTKSNGTGKKYNPSDVYNENKSIKLYAEWEYSKLNLQEPTREGYYFLGWYDSENVNFWGFPSGNELAHNSKVKNDINIYAMWSKYPLMELKDMGIESDMIFLKNLIALSGIQIQKIGAIIENILVNTLYSNNTLFS